MKRLLILGIFLTGCTSLDPNVILPEFDWMPTDLMWERNIRNCRSQPQCNAADLFDRT